LVVEHIITDPAKFEEYRAKIGLMLAKHGGRYLTKGNTLKFLGSGRPSPALRRNAVVEPIHPKAMPAILTTLPTKSATSGCVCRGMKRKALQRAAGSCVQDRGAGCRQRRSGDGLTMVFSFERKAVLKKLVAGTNVQLSKSFEVDGREMFKHGDLPLNFHPATVRVWGFCTPKQYDRSR
jgi:hypothetical protein